MMSQHYFHVHSLSTGFLGATVGLSYVLSALSVVIMVVIGFRRRTYAMPPLSVMAMLAICTICVIGPFSNQSHLFFDKSKWQLLMVWGLDGTLMAIILWQFLKFGQQQAFTDMSPTWFHVGAWAVLAVIASGVWSFIVFYQDYYVNEICPLVLLLMAVAYVQHAYAQPQWPGISASAAWLLGLSNLLLFGAVVLGNMSDPYPEAEYGYGFIYWIYSLTLFMNFVYVYQAMRRRRQV